MSGLKIDRNVFMIIGIHIFLGFICACGVVILRGCRLAISCGFANKASNMFLVQTASS